MPVENRNEREIARRVSEARRLLDEPLLNEALDRIEKQAIEDMISEAPGPPEEYRMAADRVRVIRGFRKQLELTIVNGEQALRPAKRLA
jgi:antitoxin component HigA of HigAB toxin-antitoxin module